MSSVTGKNIGMIMKQEGNCKNMLSMLLLEDLVQELRGRQHHDLFESRTHKAQINAVNTQLKYVHYNQPKSTEPVLLKHHLRNQHIIYVDILGGNTVVTISFFLEVKLCPHR